MENHGGGFNHATLKFCVPVGQCAKRWSADLEVPASIAVREEIFSAINGVQLHTVYD